MSVLDYINKMKEMYEGERITAQGSRNMADGGRIGFGDGGITLVKNKSKNVVGENLRLFNQGKLYHLRLGADKKNYYGSKEQLETIFKNRKTSGGDVMARLEDAPKKKGWLTKKQFIKFLGENNITGKNPASLANNYNINTKPNPLQKNTNLYDTSQFNPKKIEEIQKAQVKSGTATDYAKKLYPPKTKSELHEPRQKTIVKHGGIKKGSPFTGTLDTHLGHGMNIWADKITGDTLVYTPKEINLAMGKKGGLDHKIRKVSEKIEKIKKQNIPAAEKKALLEALDTTLIRMASQSQGFKKVKLSDGSTFGGDRLTIDPFDIYPGKTEVEIRDMQNKYLNKKIITEGPNKTSPAEIQKIQDAYFFEKNRKNQLKAASKIGKKEQTKIIGEVLTGWCSKGTQKVKDGGRIGFSGNCPDSEKITNMKNAAAKLKQHDRYLRGLSDTTPFADNAAAKALASKMAKSGGLLMRAGRIAMGPMTLWGEPLFEAAFVAHDILGTGTPWKEGVAKSIWAKPAISMGLLKPADQQYEEALWQVQNEEGEALLKENQTMAAPGAPMELRTRTGVKRFIDNNKKLDELNRLFALKQGAHISAPGRTPLSADQIEEKKVTADKNYKDYLESLGGAKGVTNIKAQIENDREAYDDRVAGLKIERAQDSLFGGVISEQRADQLQTKKMKDLMYQKHGKEMKGGEWIIDPELKDAFFPQEVLDPNFNMRTILDLPTEASWSPNYPKTYADFYPTPSSRYGWDQTGPIAQAGGISKLADGGRAGYMGGGIAGIRKPHAIPPERQGLRSIMINVNDD